MPWQKASWCPPGGASGAFVAAMEGVLEVHAEPGGPRRPRVNFGGCAVEPHRDVRPGPATSASGAGRPTRS